MNPWLAALLALVTLSSCVTYRLQPVSQPVDHDLVVRASALWGPEVQFTVQVQNRSGQNITVDSSTFRLYGGEDGVWSPLPLYSGQEYYARAQQQVQARPVVSVTSTDGYRPGSTTIIGSNGNVTIIRNQPTIETRTVTIVPAGSTSRLDWLGKSLFFQITLTPQAEYSGLVFAPLVRTPQLKLVIPAGGTDYVVVFERVRQNNSPFTNLN